MSDEYVRGDERGHRRPSTREGQEVGGTCTHRSAAFDAEHDAVSLAEPKRVANRFGHGELAYV
jgi:hypothetical protein